MARNEYVKKTMALVLVALSTTTLVGCQQGGGGGGLVGGVGRAIGGAARGVGQGIGAVGRGVGAVGRGVGRGLFGQNGQGGLFRGIGRFLFGSRQGGQGSLMGGQQYGGLQQGTGLRQPMFQPVGSGNPGMVPPPPGRTTPPPPGKNTPPPVQQGGEKPDADAPFAAKDSTGNGNIEVLDEDGWARISLQQERDRLRQEQSLNSSTTLEARRNLSGADLAEYERRAQERDSEVEDRLEMIECELAGLCSAG
jgi:hypothetical protein